MYKSYIPFSTLGSLDVFSIIFFWVFIAARFFPPDFLHFSFFFWVSKCIGILYQKNIKRNRKKYKNFFLVYSLRELRVNWIRLDEWQQQTLLDFLFICWEKYYYKKRKIFKKKLYFFPRNRISRRSGKCKFITYV